MGKIYNDDWMRERGFLDDEMTVSDLIRNKSTQHFYAVDSQSTLRDAFHLMKQHDLSQLPVTDGDKVVGSITETQVLHLLLENPMQQTERLIGEVMSDAFPWVEETTPVHRLSRLIDKKVPAVLCRDKAGTVHILTPYDLIQSL